MPLLVLLIVAAVAGIGAACLTRLLLRRPIAAPALEAASEARRSVSRATGWRASRLAREEATGLALTLALVALIAGGALLATLAVIVRNSDVLGGLDHAVAEWGDRHASATSHTGLTLVTDLGETWTVVIVAVAVVGIDFVRRRGLWTLPFLLVVLAGDKLATEALKQLVDRARPALEPVAATLGPSFPSGHTSTAAASWAAFALVASRWCGRRYWPALAGAAVAIAVGVALSRVLLDVHWLSDVVAGLALGWAWFAACAIAFGGRLLRFGGASVSGEASARV